MNKETFTDQAHQHTDVSIELCASLKSRYPNINLVLKKDDKIWSICSVDDQRCLNPRYSEEDYSLFDLDRDQKTEVTRIFTAYAKNCADCQRNKLKDSGKAVGVGSK